MTHAALVDSPAILDAPCVKERIAAELSRPEFCAHKLTTFPSLTFRTCPSNHLRDRLRDDSDFRQASWTGDFAFHRRDVVVGARALAAHLVGAWSYLETHEQMLKAHQILSEHLSHVTLPMEAEDGVVYVSVVEALDTLLEVRLLSIHDDEVWTPAQMADRFASLEVQIEQFRALRGKLPPESI